MAALITWAQDRRSRAVQVFSLVGFFALLLFIFIAVHRFGPAGILLCGALCGLISLPVSFVTFVRRSVIPIVTGIPCPRCGERCLERVACISFGDRFYRCAWCGQRCKRSDPGKPWVDASGPDDDQMYKEKMTGAPWFSILGSLPTRRDRINVILSIALIFSPFVLPLVGFAIGGESGVKVGTIVFWALFQCALWREYAENHRPETMFKPGLWDRELDT